ncbi:hypothetical protein BG011_008389, partial [Mortierella polycephala]
LDHEWSNEIRDDVVDAFVSVFRRIESVDLKGYLVHELEGRLSREWIRQVEMETRVEYDDPSVVPSSVLKTMRLIGNMSVELARLMSVCSNPESFNWDKMDQSSHEIEGDLVKVLFSPSTRLSNLRDIKLNGCSLSDEFHQKLFIGLRTPLTSLEINHCGNEPGSLMMEGLLFPSVGFSSIHAQSLRILIFGYCEGIGSDVNQRVLMSCPNLEIISSTTLSAFSIIRAQELLN